MEIVELEKRFKELYGDGEVRFFSAAGRVNLIGEHVDYCGGKVLPAALDMRCVTAARKNGGKNIRLAATTIDLTADLDIDKLDSYRDLKWGSYQAGVAYIMKEEGFDIVGCDLLCDCTVPFGSGLSSSAAIEVATASTLAAFSKERGGKSATKEQLAVIAQRAENEYCGVNCGIMDQFASACGKKDNVILLDCATLDYEYVPVDFAGYELVIMNSNKPHSLVESKYNERRSECEAALEKLKKTMPDISDLADITVGRFEREARSVLEGKIRDRVEHVVYECGRVRAAVAAMRCGDIGTLGKLLNESHYSMRDLYEVTGFELDTLTDIARSFEGCIGSRMTGGGFGGSAIALVEKSKVEEFIDYVAPLYEDATGYKADFYETKISDGTYEI